MHARNLLLPLSLIIAMVGCDADEPATSDDLQQRGQLGGTAGEEDGDDCAHTIGFFRNHNQFSEQPAQLIPWPIGEDTMICGHTWLEVLFMKPKGDAWVILAKQWIAAQLNVANGVDAPDEVDDAIAAAEAMLLVCSISDEERAAALDLKDTLDTFNNSKGEFCEGGTGTTDGGGTTDGAGTTDGGGTTGGPATTTAPPPV